MARVMLVRRRRFEAFRASSAYQAVADRAVRHPLVAVATVAAVARVAFALASFTIHGTYFIGDEIQYLQLADAVASGRGAEAWFPGYGQSLYHSTYSFMAPLALLFRLAPSRIVGQLLAATFGVVLVVLATVLLRRLVGPRRAVVAGVLLALVPSQVLWSSVVLRESMIWAMLALVAVGVYAAVDASLRRTVLSALGVLVGLYALARLRDQTFVVAAWALVPGLSLIHI